MSRSYHETYKDLKGLSKKELDEMAKDEESTLKRLAKKSQVKREVKKGRKSKKIKITKRQQDL